MSIVIVLLCKFFPISAAASENATSDIDIFWPFIVIGSLVLISAPSISLPLVLVSPLQSYIPTPSFSPVNLHVVSTSSVVSAKFLTLLLLVIILSFIVTTTVSATTPLA